MQKRKNTFSWREFTLKKLHMKLFNSIVTLLLIVGGLNWGLVGLFEFDLVQSIFGQGTLMRVIYTVVGLSALSKVILWSMEEATE